MEEKEAGKCIRCNNPVYIAPNGHVAKLCAICIFRACSKLGLIPPIKVTITVDPPASA